MTVDEKIKSSIWSREQDKAFENALASYPEDDSDRWEKIAADIPGKTLEDIKDHYELLVDDVNQIESGFIPLPSYSFSSGGSPSRASEEGTGKGDYHGFDNSESRIGSRAPRSEERRKGTAWTEDEHRLFLLGLDKYGKGDWRSISRNFVVTRTPTQVASHAQKYFIRLNSMNKDRRRSSIHDITSVDNGDVSAPQGPITGEAHGYGAGGSSNKSTIQHPQPPTGSFGVGIYGAPTVRQPVGGPFVSAVGTPVNNPPPAHMGYAISSMVTRPSVNMSPITY